MSKTETRYFDIDDPESYDLYDPFLHGTVTINGTSYTGAAALEALRRNSGQQQDRDADRRNAEREVERERKIAEATAANTPWLEAWQRASADLERQSRETMAELTAAVRADPVGSAFIRLLALQKAKDVGREIANQKRAETRGASAPGGTGFRHPTSFEELMNRILGDAAADTKGLLQQAIDAATDA